MTLSHTLTHLTIFCKKMHRYLPLTTHLVLAVYLVWLVSKWYTPLNTTPKSINYHKLPPFVCNPHILMFVMAAYWAPFDLRKLTPIHLYAPEFLLQGRFLVLVWLGLLNPDLLMVLSTFKVLQLFNATIWNTKGACEIPWATAKKKKQTNKQTNK